MSEHAQRKHALLSASSSAMWSACPPSARLNDAEPEDTSEYAEQGTLGHELTEIELLYQLGRITHDEWERKTCELQAHALFTPDLDDAITRCVEFGWRVMLDALTEDPDALILLEERIDFSRWVPEGFGTSDLCVVTKNYLHTIDWKFGQGEVVSAIENSQLRLYAAGALDAFGAIYDFKEVRSTVVQPRVGNIETETLTPRELIVWADSIAPRAQLAWKGEGEFNPGAKQCRWCKVRGKCRARAEANLALASQDFDFPVMLNDEELGKLYPQMAEFIEWAKDIMAHAEARVLRGSNVPGLKAVEGKSNRVITDNAEAIKLLTLDGFDWDSITEPVPELPQRLLPLTKLEKVVGPGRLKDVLGDLISKPPGRLIVVPSTDKRNAVELSPTTPEEDFK